MTGFTAPRYSPSIAKPTDRRPVNLCAWIVLVTTFPLIWMGGIVTSKDAGMSVPDWPNSYGYNMFTFPVSQWVGGIFYEHTHRLLGTVVGAAAIALAIVAWVTETRRWVRWLCVAVLISVIVQGVLGGLRVRLNQLDLAVIHGCVAHLFFCLASFACVVTSRWWSDVKRINQLVDEKSTQAFRKLSYVCVACVVLLVLQLAVAACMRHYKAGLAIPDFPTTFGGALPPISDEGLKTATRYRLANYQLPAATMAQIWMHFSHRIGAVLVTGVASVAIGIVALRLKTHRRFVILAAMIAMLLVTQLTLGILTVLLGKPADIASAHVATGALLLMTTFVLTVSTMRMRAVQRLIVVESKPVRDRPLRTLETSRPAATI